MTNEYESALIHAIEAIHELMEENRELREELRQTRFDRLKGSLKESINGEKPTSADGSITLRDFLSKYVNRNAIVRLWKYDSADAELCAITGDTRDTSMAWQVIEAEGVYGGCGDCTVKYVSSIGVPTDSDHDAINIVVGPIPCEVTTR